MTEADKLPISPETRATTQVVLCQEQGSDVNEAPAAMKSEASKVKSEKEC